MCMRTNNAFKSANEIFSKAFLKRAKLSDAWIVWARRPDRMRANRKASRNGVFRSSLKCLYYRLFGPNGRTVRQLSP
jgi:hypothetical protein